MKFDELGAKMREYETASDRRVLPCVFIVARIDGRNFTRLTKEICEFEAPFDARFRDLMIETTQHLMTCGFDALYGYTQSDEISLLLAKEVKTFERKERKLISVLAGEAICTRATIEAVCRKHNLNAEKSGWTHPRPRTQVAEFRPTPELVHGVTVSNPLLAKLLKQAGYFSGKEVKVYAGSNADEYKQN